MGETGAAVDGYAGGVDIERVYRLKAYIGSRRAGEYAKEKILSVDKGKHAGQRVFPALFAPLISAGSVSLQRPPFGGGGEMPTQLACASKSAPKSTENSSPAGVSQLCRSRNAADREKPQGILAVWARGPTGWGCFCPSNRACSHPPMVQKEKKGAAA